MDHHHRHRDNTPEHGSNPNSRTKPQRKNLGTPGDNESYNKKTTEVSAGDVFPEENPEAYDSQGSNDARRKGELNHAIFVKLQEISQYNIEIGNYDEGLANYDRCIDHLLRTLPQGPSASMFKDFLIKTVKYLNEVALKLLQEEKVKDSLLLLERCRKMTHPNSFGPYPTLRSLTYNHLGCCYRRIGKLDKAVYYLEKAWEFIQDIERVETSGITHINLCAVLSQLGDHKRALEHATMAVSDCSFDLIEATKKNAESGDPKANVHKQATMLAIAYHNLATEEEACKNGEAALQAYLRAYNLIREHNHPQHELCQKFGRAYEEARARISKPGFNKRAASPGEAARRYGTSPPGSRQVVVKRPASFNTANKAAKAYLQNNRVVIPKRQGTAVQQPRPLLSSPQNAQLTQKLFVPSASQRKIERPVTAHPQSRTQHYQVSGLNETPRNQKESVQKHEDEEDDEAPNRPSHSEANSEIERLGLDDEDLEKADLKSNRLAFLQSLNQYNMDKSSKGGVVPQRNNFMGGTPDNKAAAQQQQEQGHQEKRARIQSAKPQGRAQAKPKVDQAKIDKAVVKLQSFCRGYLARQEVAKVLAETPQQVYLVLIAETVKGNLENGPYSKETLYFFLMIYELDSQLIHIHIKNLENRKFHRALVEYQVANRTSKAAIINELREACERLIQHLEIHNDQIVFRDDVTDRGQGEKPEELYMMGQELARREAENAITQITERTEERTDESEVRPLGSKKEEEELGSEGGHRKPGHSHSHSHSGDMIEDKIEEEGLIVDDIAEEDDRYEEEGFDEEPADKKKQQKSKPKQQKQQEVEEEVEEFEEPVVDTNDIAGLVGLKLFGGRDQEEVDKAAQTIQKHVKGKLERDKYQVAKDKKKEEEEKKRKKDEEEKRKKEEAEKRKKKEEEERREKEEEEKKKKEEERKKKEEAEKRKKEEEERREKEEEEKKKKEEEERKKKKEEEEELPNLEDPDVQNATLTIQKAYKRKEEEKKKKEEQEKKKKEEEEKAKKEEEEKKKKKEEEEELPNLEDPDVQNATLAIQKAYKRKEPEKKKKEEEEKKKKEEEEKKKKEEEEKKKKEEEEEELPNLEDPDVQNATLAIQKAYKRKEQEKKKKEEEKKKQEEEEKKKKEEEEKKKKEEEEELPNLEDPDVQNATLTIQKAYKKKEEKKKKEEEERKKKEEEEKKKKEEEEKKKKEEEELPNLEDPDVQNATLTIQKAYKKKKDKKEVKEEPKQEEKQSEEESQPESVPLPRRDTISLYRAATKDELDKAAQTIQKHIKGKLTRDTFGLTKDHRSKLVFSRATRVQGNIISFKLVERGDDPDSYIVSCKNITTNKKFETIEIPKKSVNLKTLTIDGLVEILNVDVYAPKVTLKDKFKGKVGQKSPAYDEEFDVEEEEEEVKPVEKNKKEGDGTEFLASVPLYFGKEKLDSTIHYDKKKDQILVKHGFEHGKEAKSLDIPVQDLEIGTEFSKDYFISNMDIVLLSKLNYKNGNLVYDRSPMHLPATKIDMKEKKLATPNKRYNQDFDDKDLTSVREDEDNKKEGHSALQESYRSGNFEVNQEAEELIGKKGGQIRTQSIDAVGEVGHYRSGNVFAPGQVKMGKGTAEAEKQKKKEVDDELPNLEDPDVQNATLTIQKAYKNKKDKKVQEVQEKPKQQEEEKHQHKHKEEEEELPDLEDKDVQKATLTIQNAYKNKKNKQNKPAKEEPKPQPKEAEEEELPNLEDKDVQNATLTIQKAYKNKKNKQNKPAKEEPKPQVKEEEEELPDLEDKDVQNATLTIQKAYKNKKNKQNKVPEPPVEEKPVEKEDELPNLEDKDVQNATLTIQKAYKNKKNKQNKPAQEEPQHHHHHQHHHHKKEEEEELPNLEDKDVQNATLTIQKAYKNKKNKQNKPVKEEPKPQEKEEEELPNLEDKDVQNATLTIQKAYKNKKNKQNKPAQEEPQQHHHHHEHHKKEEEEELPNLEDKDVQNATLTIQKAYKNKKNKQNKPIKEEPKPQPKEEEEELPNLEDKDVQNATLTIQKAYKNKKNKQNKPIKEEPKPQPKEEEEELPNLEDKDVQNATLTIQKAYKNKKNKQNKPAKEELIIPEPIVEKPKKKEEEEELPNLEDKDVQNATLTIQKAYKNKKNKQNQPVKEEPVIPEPVIEKPKQKEEEEELPNLEDPEVQNATLAIQKAYLKKKSKAAQPEKKPSPKKEVKPAARKDDSADDYDYEPDFSEPKTSPVKPKPQVVADKKDKKADKSENFELMNVTNEQKPEDVEKLLKEVNDEFDVFNQKDNRSDDDNKPYDEEEAPPKKKSPPKKKANDDDEDFEPIEGDF